MHKPSSYKVIWVKITMTFSSCTNHWVPWEHFYICHFSNINLTTTGNQNLYLLVFSTKNSEGLGWTLCLYRTSLRREERYQIFVGNTGRRECEGGFWARSMSSPWLSVSFTWAAVVLCKDRKLWVHILSGVLVVGRKSLMSSLQTVVSRDWNISTWERDSGTTPARAEVPGHQEQLWEFSVENSRCTPGEEANNYPKGASPCIA